MVGKITTAAISNVSFFQQKDSNQALCILIVPVYFSPSFLLLCPPLQHSSTPFSASLLSSSKTVITGLTLHCHSSMPVWMCALVFCPSICVPACTVRVCSMCAFVCLQSPCNLYMGVVERVHFHVYALCCALHVCTYRVVHPLVCITMESRLASIIKLLYKRTRAHKM